MAVLQLEYALSRRSLSVGDPTHGPFFSRYGASPYARGGFLPFAGFAVGFTDTRVGPTRPEGRLRGQAATARYCW